MQNSERISIIVVRPMLSVSADRNTPHDLKNAKTKAHTNSKPIIDTQYKRKRCATDVFLNNETTNASARQKVPFVRTGVSQKAPLAIGKRVMFSKTKKRDTPNATNNILRFHLSIPVVTVKSVTDLRQDLAILSQKVCCDSKVSNLTSVKGSRGPRVIEFLGRWGRTWDADLSLCNFVTAHFPAERSTFIQKTFLGRACVRIAHPKTRATRKTRN